MSAGLIAAFAAALGCLLPAGASAQSAECNYTTISSTGQTQGSRGREAVAAEVQTPQRVLVCTTPGARDSSAAFGGGSGGDSRCSVTPIGDPAEVWRVYQAVNAAQTPAPTDTAYVSDIPQSPSGPDRVVTSSWYRVEGEQVQILYSIECVDPPRDYSDWFTVRPDGSGGFVPEVRAVDLLPALRDRVTRQLPTPVPRITPADESSHGWTYVTHRTFFWVDQAPGQWATVTGTAAAGGVSVTVTAEPVRFVVDPGDGSDPVICEGAPPAITLDVYHPDIDGCHHRYRNSSAMAPNGESFPVTVTIIWHASWSASTGEGGDLGTISTTSPPRDLQVAEIQAVIVDRDP